MPTPEEPDPLLLRGRDLNIDGLVNKMGEFAHRTVLYNRSIRHIGRTHSYSATKMDDKQEHLQAESIRNTIRTTMVGRHIHRLLNFQGKHIVVTESRREDALLGAALLDCSNESSVEDNIYYIEEPHISVLAYGIQREQGSHRINSAILNEIASEIIGLAHNFSSLLYPIFGTRFSAQFTPTVSLHPLKYVKPTIDAESIQMGIDNLLMTLLRVQEALPKLNTGFADKLALVHNSIQDLLREQPDHSLVQAIKEWKDLDIFENTTRLGGDEATYKRARNIAGAARKLLDSIIRGVDSLFEQLYPGSAQETLEPVIEHASTNGSIDLHLQLDGSKCGSAHFKPTSLTDSHPETEFSIIQTNMQEDGGILSELAATLLKEVSKGEWWSEQLRQK